MTSDFSPFSRRALLRPAFRALVGTLVLVPLANMAVAAPEKCQLSQLAEIPVTFNGTQPLIDASINGQPVRMAVDTGSDRTGIWVDTAKRLGLETVGSGLTFYGSGGGAEARIATVRQFGLGRFTVSNLRLYVLPTGATTSGVAGILGEDFLSKLDIEFDLPEKTIRLVQTKNCVGDQVVYWAQSYAMVGLVHPIGGGDNWLLAHLGLNGHEVLGTFDSGTSITLVSARAVYGLGKSSVKSGAVEQLHGLGGPATTDLSTATFAMVTVGQENIQNVTLAIGDVFKHDRVEVTGTAISQSALPTPDLIIGADFFRAHRIFIANSQSKLYFTYSGGPIFALPQRRAAAAAAIPPPPAPAARTPQATASH